LASNLIDSDLFGEITHRLRNPVAGIRTTAQVLLGRIGRRDDLPESWAELVGRIVKETHNMEAALNDLERAARPSDSDTEAAESTGEE
jgi:signal transduction histidine kinase